MKGFPSFLTCKFSLLHYPYIIPLLKIILDFLYKWNKLDYFAILLAKIFNLLQRCLNIEFERNEVNFLGFLKS